METKDITAKTIDYIERTIKTHLLRFGVNVDVFVKIGKYIEMQTSEFQTFPVIFKTIWVSSVTTLGKDDLGYYINFPLSFKYQHFRGGSNGVDIGDIKFYIIENKGEQYAFCPCGISTCADVPYHVWEN